MSTASDRGQATVELALCLPVLVILVAALFEIGMLATDRVRLVHAAREAARVAVVEHDPQRVIEAARAGGLHDLDVVISPGPESRVQGSPLTVRLSYRPPGRVPLLGALFQKLELESRAVMRIERP